MGIDRLRMALKPLLHHRNWQKSGGMFGIAVILGLTGGVVAALFKAALDLAQEWVLLRFTGFPFSPDTDGMLPRSLFFLVPAVGGLLSGLLVYRFAPDAAGAGTDALIDAFHNKGGHIPIRTSVVKFLASVVTLGSGGSAGQEGPMAQIGGGLGSMFARLFRVPDRMRRILLLTGTAAGLGAIFHAPLGAALTAAEIVYREDFESQGFLPFAVASVVAFACFSVLTNQHSSYLHFPLLPFADIPELLNYALVGLVCIPFSKAFVSLYRMTQGFFERLKIRNFLKPAIGGLLVGLLAYLCPQAAGANWSYLTDALSGNFGFSALLFIACMKILATCLTIGSGGSGGVFGPSLFIGGMLGGAVGFGLHALEPGLVSNPGSYVLVGMGAFFSGAAKAPMAGLIMVCEITGNYGLLAPLLIASTVHLAFSRKWSLYKSQRHDKFSSPVHEHLLRVDVLKHVPLSRILPAESQVVTLAPEYGLVDALETVRGVSQDVFPVVGKSGLIEGLVTSSSLHFFILGALEDHPAKIGDLMTEGFALESGMDLREALTVFLESGATQLPVLGPDGNIQAMIRLHEIMGEYEKRTQADRAGFPVAGRTPT